MADTKLEPSASSVRGILKHKSTIQNEFAGSSNYGIPSSAGKTAKFDELNVLSTFHPLNKDYGHMIIDEPKTPYVHGVEPQLDTETLVAKLRVTALSQTPVFGIDDDGETSSEEEEYAESLEEKVRRLEFERRRKAHYKEFESVAVARRLIAEEFADISDTEDLSIYHEDGIKQSSTSLSCEQEICPSYDTNYMYEDNVVVPTDEDNDSDDGTPPPPVAEQEPGQQPGHPCYHKLLAEMELKKEISFSKTVSKSDDA